MRPTTWCRRLGPTPSQPTSVRNFGLRLAALTNLFVVVATVSGDIADSPASADQPVTVSPTQQLVRLLNPHKAFSAIPPGRRSTVTTVRAVRPITGGPTVLPLIGTTTSTAGARWLRVMLPGRPNGMTGWIKQLGTVQSTTGWRLVVQTSRRQVLVYHYGRLIRSFAAIVGKPETPTPRGQFFVEESVRMPPGSPGAPFALALSARSNVLQEFEGGPGQIALHGLANLGGRLGTAISHGCVRLSNQDIAWLATRIEPGVPVRITA